MMTLKILNQKMKIFALTIPMTIMVEGTVKILKSLNNKTRHPLPHHHHRHPFRRRRRHHLIPISTINIKIIIMRLSVKRLNQCQLIWTMKMPAVKMHSYVKQPVRSIQHLKYHNRSKYKYIPKNINKRNNRRLQQRPPIQSKNILLNNNFSFYLSVSFPLSLSLYFCSMFLYVDKYRQKKKIFN